MNTASEYGVEAMIRWQKRKRGANTVNTAMGRRISRANTVNTAMWNGVNTAIGANNLQRVLLFG